jgi:hypothetical protein
VSITMRDRARRGHMLCLSRETEMERATG